MSNRPTNMVGKALPGLTGETSRFPVILLCVPPQSSRTSLSNRWTPAFLKLSLGHVPPLLPNHQELYAMMVKRLEVRVNRSQPEMRLWHSTPEGSRRGNWMRTSPDQSLERLSDRKITPIKHQHRCQRFSMEWDS